MKIEALMKIQALITTGGLTIVGDVAERDFGYQVTRAMIAHVESVKGGVATVLMKPVAALAGEPFGVTLSFPASFILSVYEPAESVVQEFLRLTSPVSVISRPRMAS